jgi:hypothetical protein
MTSGIQADTSWSDLAQSDAASRQRAMEERFARLAAKGEDERLHEIEAMILAEYSLGEKELQEFTASRLRAWIALEQRDPAQAQAATRGYDRVFDRMPGDLAMRRATVVQTVARQELSAEEIEALFDLIPSMVRHLPRAKQDIMRNVESQNRIEAARTRTAAGRAKKPFWKFW